MKRFDERGVVHAEVEQPALLDGLLGMNISVFERIFGDDHVVDSPAAAVVVGSAWETAVDQSDPARPGLWVLDEALVRWGGVEGVQERVDVDARDIRHRGRRGAEGGRSCRSRSRGV